MLRKRIAALALAATAPLLATALGAGTAHADGYTAIHFANNFCLDVKDGWFANNQPVQIWGCNSTDAQTWSIESVDYTHFQIVASRRSPDKQALCLNNIEGGDRTGNHLRLYYCSQSSAKDATFNKTYYGGHVQLQPRVASANCLNSWGGLYQGAEARLYGCYSGPEENVWADNGQF
ncbi:RICIN domain-containing protein [Streptomyces sp. NRAIS4]